MTSKLIPQDPESVMVIRELVPGVTTLSVPFLRFGLIKFGGRATIVKLQSGALAVFNPVALTPTVRTTLSTLGGPIAYLIAPDLEHHIFLSSWSAAFPSAHIIAPEGLAKKRAQLSKKDKEVTNVPFGTVFTKKGKEEVRVGGEFDGEFEYEFVDAHPNKELVFHHKASKTLIEADLLFNLPATEQYSRSGVDARTGWATKIFAGIQSTKGSAMAQRRMLWYAFSSSDRQGFNKSMRKINSWGFENIVPAHGDSIVGDGKGIFEKVMAWHLEGINKK